MSAPHTRPYGSWTSPLSAAEIASGAIGLSEIRLDGDAVYWLEMRPSEGGRSVVVRHRPDGTVEDAIPDGYNARTRVHEYGGGSYLVADGVIYFSNFSDQRVYRLRPDGAAAPLTPPGGLRYADYAWDARRRRIVCRARGSHARRRAPQYHRRAGPGRPRAGPGARGGPGFLRGPAAQPGRRLARVAGVEPSPHAVGCRRTLDGAGRGSWCVGQAHSHRGRRPRVGHPTCLVTRRHAPLRVGPQRLVEPVPRRQWSRRATDRPGGGVRHAALGVRDDQLRLRRPASHPVLPHPPGDLGARQSRHEHRATLADRPPLHRHRLGPMPRLSGGLSGRVARRAVVGHPPRPGIRPSPGPASLRHARDRPRVPVGARAHRVPDRGWSNGPRPLLSPQEPGLRGAAGRAAPAGGDDPRGPDLHDLHGPAVEHPVLHQPGDRRPGRELRRQHRVRAGVSRAALRGVGGGGRGRLLFRGDATWPPRGGWTGSASPSGVGAPAVTPRWPASPFGRSSPPGPATTGSATARCWPRTRTSSSRATWTP